MESKKVKTVEEQRKEAKKFLKKWTKNQLIYRCLDLSMELTILRDKLKESNSEETNNISNQ